MDLIDELYAKLSNQTEDLFTFDATNIDGIFKYLKTIDWTETWIVSLVSFHAATFLVVLLTKSYMKLQTFIFVVLLCMCLLSEKINEYAAQNWRLFAREQYFDSNGLFISIMFSTPIILNTSIIVAFWLHENYKLLKQVVKLKQKQSSKKTK